MEFTIRNASLILAVAGGSILYFATDNKKFRVAGGLAIMLGLFIVAFSLVTNWKEGVSEYNTKIVGRTAGGDPIECVGDIAMIRTSSLFGSDQFTTIPDANTGKPMSCQEYRAKFPKP